MDALRKPFLALAIALSIAIVLLVGSIIGIVRVLQLSKPKPPEVPSSVRTPG